MVASVDIMKTSEYMVSTSTARREADDAMNAYLRTCNPMIVNQHYWEDCNRRAMMIGVKVLRSRLTISARRALQEFVPLAVRNKGATKLSAFFNAHGFKNIPSIELLKRIDESMTIPYSRSNRFRCEEGTDIVIDWEKKAFVFSSWSSDD